jgi:hypothetical protein
VTIELTDLTPAAEEGWATLFEFRVEVHPSWVLVGGQMMHMLAVEYGGEFIRTSEDMDMVVNVRAWQDEAAWLSKCLEDRGFVLEGVSADLIGHRFKRPMKLGKGSAIVDVLAPSGIGSRASTRTVGSARTVRVGTGAQVAGQGLPSDGGVVGFLAVVASCAFCLRGLRTPTVGFDARGLVLTQSAYPPLVSASAAVAWRVTGLHTARLGVTTIAVLNMCALAADALALVDAGRIAANPVAGGGLIEGGDTSLERGAAPVVGQADLSVRPPWAPMLTGVIAAVLLIFVASGATEPILTNGYADPLWSLAAVGAVAFGLQARTDGSTRAQLWC